LFSVLQRTNPSFQDIESIATISRNPQITPPLPNHIQIRYYPRVFLRRAAIALTVVFIIAIVAIGVLLVRNKNRLYSDPSLPRESKAFTKAFTPVTNTPSIDTTDFKTSIVRSNDTEVRIEFPKKFAEPPDYQHAFLLAEGSNAVSFADSQVTLQTIAVNCAPTGGATNTAYYSSSGERLDPAKTRRTLPMQSGGTPFRGTFPHADFYFQSTNLPSDVMLVGFQAFDHRTRRLRTSGHSSAIHRDATTTIWIAADIELWHQTPIDVVLTIATGPIELTSHPIDLSAPPIPFPGGMLKLLHISDAEINSWGTDINNGTNFVTLSTDRDAKPPKTSFVFFGWPTMQGLPLQFQLARADGQPAQHAGRSSSDSLLIATVEEKPADLAKIEMRYYPNVYRLVFHLPELPGLPEENRNLQNLFDTRIPYIRMPYLYAYQSTILKLIDMNAQQIPLTYSNLSFPVIRTNTTARELFREMDHLASDPEKILVVDPVKNEVRYERSTLHSLLNKAKKKLSL
jgi:hypothetical protein